MTDNGHSRAELDARRRKLRFRSWHRGMREMDLLLGPFADARIDDLTEEQIDQYESLLEVVDPELLPILTGEKPVPSGVHSEILKEIVAFRQTS